MNLSTTTDSHVSMEKGKEAQYPVTDKLAAGVKFDDVYITPAYLKFTEAIEGIAYRQRITIRNVGNKSVFIRIRQSSSISFQVEALQRGVRVSPGLSVTTCVIYCFKRPSLLQATIPIEIDGKIFDYRVVCTLATEGISIEPKSIDFGIIDVGSSGLKIIRICNEGGKSTKFSIDLGQNDFDIMVKPLRGIVRPRREVKLRVELIGAHEGVFYSEFWIKSIPDIRVPIKVNIIVPRLVVYHPNTIENLTLIDFPSTVENTSRYDSFVLRNLSSRATSYVVFGELDNEVKCIREIDRKRYPVYNTFAIRPVEGQMEPFQGVIFEVKFSPTTKLSQSQEQKQAKCGNEYQNRRTRDFVAFIRIVKTRCTKTNIKIDPVKDTALDNTLSQRIYIQDTTETSSSSTSCASSVDSGINNVMKLCLYGEVKVARLFIEPDILYFGDLLVGQVSQRILRFTSALTVAPMYLKCAPNAAARCCPNSMRLKPNASVEVLVKVRGKESVEPSFKLFFDVMVDSYDSTVSGRSLQKVTVRSYPVECTVNIILKSRKGVLSQRSLPVKAMSDNEEIMKRILRSPRWKYKHYLEVVDKFASCVRRPPLEKSILTIKTAVLIPLSPLQIYNIHIPNTLTFGTVAPNSFNYRQLVARNTNDIPIMIRLVSLSPKCIQFPEGNLMILQPGSTTTRLVEYRASYVGKFHGYIDYVINSNHFFDLSVTANVVHKQLHIDKEEVELGKEWSSEEAYRPMASVVQITNKLSARTCFKWEVPAASGFHVEPSSGSVRGDATLHAYIYYESDDAKTSAVQALMKSESGGCALLRLRTARFASKVEFINDQASLGEIPLNLPTKINTVLRNFEFNEVIYEVDSASLVRGCNVSPLRGKISPRGIAVLEVHLTFDVCCHFSTAIAVSIQGGSRLLYKIHGTVSFPQLKILPQRINMKVDASQTHRIVATNIGTTILKLQFLLSDYPELRISLSANSKNSNIGAEGVTIAPSTSRELYLHFQPADLVSCSYYLPMMMNQLLGPALLSNPKSIRPSEFLELRQAHYAHLSGFVMMPLPDKLPTVTIDYTVIDRVIFFSKLSFQFNVATNELSEELHIENRGSPREKTVLINIEELNQVDCPFVIEWIRGVEARRTSDSIECTLQPDSSVRFLLEFKPKKRGVFSVEVPIRVLDELFGKLRLDGEFPASAIDAEPYWIYLTPVPLGTAIKEQFKIRARNFDNAASLLPISAKTPRRSPQKCSDLKNKQLLHIEFPNGNVVPPHLDVELEASVTFKSDHPISFCSTIEFRDDRSLAVCFLTVYATADDNLLTTHMYSMGLSIFHDAWTATKHLEKRMSRLSISLDTNEDHDDRRASRVYRRRELSELRSNRNSLENVTDLKVRLIQSEEVNSDEIDNMHMDEKRTMEVNGKRMSIRKRDSALSVNAGTRHRTYSKRSSHSYHVNDDQNDDCEKYMQRVTTIAEEWMYSSPLKFHFYPSIPFGITAAFSNYCARNETITRSSKRKNNATNLSSFIDLLESLVGSKIRDHLSELSRQSLPENDVERVYYVLQLYDKTLDFLLAHGAHLIHVSAQILLNYDDYLISIDIAQSNANDVLCSKDLSLVFSVVVTAQRKKPCEEIIYEEHKPLSRQLFESRSKQYWLDVILQTYKCFVLTGIHEYKFQTSSSFTANFSRKSTVYRESMLSSISNLPRQWELHEKAIRSIVNTSNDKISTLDHCPEERFLLAWLQYHYEQQRARDWMSDHRVILNPREKQDTAASRLVRNFHSDLSDSLVLIAVTVTYCPFLVDECFGNLYICPRNNEEALHNAICLVTAWRKIRLGFIITPMQLINPNCVQMLMLVVHLFLTLPSYVPCAKIKLSCPLSKTATKQINISNPTNNIVKYLLSFVNSTSHFFTILKPASIIYLKAHKSGQVQVQFHAKKIQKCKAYLLFCGCAIGSHFGRNQTIVLEGHIDNLRIANEYTVRSKLYKIFNTNLRISVPYRNAADYDIWITEERPSHPSTLKMTRWCELHSKKIPRRLFLNQKSIIVAEDALEARLSITVACMTPKQRTFWLIFQAKIGDFIIQINSAWQRSINDRIIIKWTNQGKCICSDQRVKETCPFNISVPIPLRNSQLWKCVAETFQKTLDSKERLFWSKYLNTSDTFGLHLIRWLMEDGTDSETSEFAHIFDSAVTYKVVISDKSNLLTAPECFTIHDVKLLNEQIPIKIHILPTTPSSYETTMTLTSINGRELRVYTINCSQL